MNAERPAGPILDELGVTFSMDDTSRVVQVLVLAKTIDLDDGMPALVVASNGLDWIDQAGLVAAYGQVAASIQPATNHADDC